MRSSENQLKDRDSHKEIKACRYWPASHTDTEEERNARSIPVVANPSTDTTAPLCFRWVGQSFIRNHRAQRVLSPFFAFQKGPHTVDRRTTRYWTYCRVWAANDKQAGILSCNQPKLHSHRQEVQIWELLSPSHLQQRIGEAVFQERIKKGKLL